MNIIVTGGAGFIGSNFVFHMLKKYPDYRIICLDKLTYAGNLSTLAPVMDNPNFRFVKADICDREAVDKLFEEEHPDIVVNFAAESHVDRSIEDPGIFLQTNIIGTSVLMDACRKYGIQRYHQVSTDEVYGDLPLDRPDLFFTEETPIHTSSPYSSSKAAADLLVLAYHRTYGLPVTISRCSNNYGPYVVENRQAVPLEIKRFGNLDDAMSQYQALPNHYMKALGVEKNPDPLPGSLDVLQCKNGIDTIVEDYKTVPGWDNPYVQNHVVQPLQGALAVQEVELAYKLPDAYFHIQTCEDGFDYTLYNKDFTERDGGILETDGDKPVQEAMTELLTEFGCNAAEGRVMDAAELREQADTVAEQQAEVLKERLAAERPAPEETLSFYVAECLEFTFAGEFHDHLTMEEALEVYDKIPSERMNADKCIGFCIEEDGGFVGMYELVVNDKVQRENINSINYFRDDKLVQQAISDMEKLMAARQQSKEQEHSNTKKSVLDALRSLKAKKQEQPAQEQDKPKKAKKKGMEL